MAGMRLRKYGVQATIDFEVFNTDGVDLNATWVPAQVDCEIMKDGGASTLCDNTATDEGVTFSIVLTATEMQFARGVLKIQDAATKVILDTVIHIETYGHASAQHLNFPSDLTHVMGTILTEGGAGRLAAAIIKLFDVVAPTLVASSVMRGTDSANTTVPDAAGVAPTAVEIQAEMEANGASVLDTLRDDLVDGGRLDLLIDDIKAVTDNMAAAAGTMITGTVSWDNTNATTTVIYSDDVTEATADHYNGRLFVPTSGALVGQYTNITDYALDTGEGKFTVTALTEAPADNTTFVII